MAPSLRHSAICRQYVYVPLRSVLDKRHWRLATQARSTSRSYCLARPMSVSHCVQARPAPQPPSGAFIVNFHAALARGTTTHESQMAPCLRRSAICRRYSRFTFCLRHNPRSYRLVGKCPRIRPIELARLCVHLPSFHSKKSLPRREGSSNILKQI